MDSISPKSGQIVGPSKVCVLQAVPDLVFGSAVVPTKVNLWYTDSVVKLIYDCLFWFEQSACDQQSNLDRQLF